ncbi:MAG: (2Fe-2S) ferredoxin domain-containing protein, partial [Sedimentisphaerales bacterium]|nr:(2Fe-2S) ferredoxin domain-containing protein [Sedimentisphaerales bacterium]
MIANNSKCLHGLDKVNDKLMSVVTGNTSVAAEEIATLTRKKITKPVILVGTGTCGLAAGAGETLRQINAYLGKNKISADVIEVGCIGLCAYEPIIEIQIPGKTRVTFQGVTGEKVAGILENSLAGKMVGEE